MSGRAVRRVVGLAAGLVFAASATACGPPAAPAPTRLALTTQLTWCGGMIPPPGEPWCHTNPSSTTVQVMSDPRTVLTTVTTAADGTATVDLPAGRYRLQVADVPVYMTCESPTVTVVAEQTTPVTVGCTVMAP